VIHTKRIHRALATLLLASLVACGQAQPPQPELAASERIATIDGKPISRAGFEMYVANVARQNGGRSVDPEQRAQVLDQFIGLHLAAAVGEKSNLSKDPKVAEELAYARTNVLAQAAMQKYLEDNPIKDEELKPAYDAGVAKLPLQHRTRHILVADEKAASDLIKQLKGGANFDKLARKRSLDASKAAGGDLGWLVAEDMLPPYAAAVATLKPGEMTEAPVQSEFGWHVIRLEESRPQETAPFEEVKDKVLLLLKRERVKTYMDSLRQQAKIEKNVAAASTPPLPPPGSPH
jgi:peptidyl-prolyl cis-trans isomerase C